MQLYLPIGKKYPEITGPMSDAFAMELTSVAESGDFTELILDFEGTRTISSMAMGALFATKEKLKKAGKALYIINAGERVTHLLSMVNMAGLLS